jgi:hypothetical protein
MNAEPQHARRSLPHATPTTNRRLVRLYVFAIAIWGLDFRSASAGAGAAIQGLMLVVYLVCFFRIIGAGAQRGFGIGALWALLLAILLFLVDSSTVAMIYQQKTYSVIVNCIPVSLYFTTAALTYVTLSILKDDNQGWLNGLRLACILSGILHVLIVFVFGGGINLATSRYEVLSGAIVPSLGVLAVGLAQPWSMLDMVVVLVSLAIAVVSVTRTLVITLAVQIAGVFIVRPSALFRRAAIRGVALFGLIVFAVVALDFAAGTGLTERWTDRLFLSHKLGSDPSGLSRVSESRYMWDRFGTSPETVVFGNGLAAITSLVGPEHLRAELLVGKDMPKDALHSPGIGHENYLSILYVAGLFGGGGILLIQFLNALQSLALIRTLQQRPTVFRESDVHIGIWGAVIVLGMLTVGFLAGTFADRDECLWLGVGTGMLYWGRELVRRLAAPDAALATDGRGNPATPAPPHYTQTGTAPRSSGSAHVPHRKP